MEAVFYFWAIFLIVFGLLFYSANRKEWNEQAAQIKLLEQEKDQNPARMNQVIEVTILGGLLGYVLGSPKQSLNLAIRKANLNGWQVIQILPSDSDNFISRILNGLLLVITLFLYTRLPGYYLVLARKEKLVTITKEPFPQILNKLNCPKCEAIVQKADNYCENCGQKLV